MKRLFFIFLLLGAIVFGYNLGTTEAADPLTFRLEQVEAFRHVLETGDWLILGRLYLVPTEQTQNTDSFSVSTTGGDFDDPVTLTNNVYLTSGTDWITEADGTDITDTCGLGLDLQTITCTSTGLADNTYAVTVAYRSGWNAYSAGDVFVRLYDASTLLVERTAARVSYGLVGIYLSASDVASLGVTWGDSNIVLTALGTPNEWAGAYLTTKAITWQATANLDATATTLTTRLRLLLGAIEQDDSTVDSGDYVGALGITDAGAQLAVDAFVFMKTAIPEAFLTTTFSPVPTAVTTPNATSFEAIQTDVEGTSIYSSIQAINPMAGIVIALIGSFFFGGLAFVKTRNVPISALIWYVCLVGAWLLFAIPFQVVFLPAAAIIALFFGWVARKVFD